jgi:hypothetical protein
MDNYDWNCRKGCVKKTLHRENKIALYKYKLFINGIEIKASPKKGQYALRGKNLYFSLDRIRGFFEIVNGKRFITHRFFWDCSNGLEKKLDKFRYRYGRGSHVEIKIIPVKKTTKRRQRTKEDVIKKREENLKIFKYRLDSAKKDIGFIESDYQNSIERAVNSFNRNMKETKKKIKKTEQILANIEGTI